MPYRVSHIKELKMYTEELKKYTVEDFRKAEKILLILDKYERESLCWSGKNHIDFEKALSMLDRCIWLAGKNDSSEF